ncbi:phosphodiester glycosidase family protein [Paenibacillus thiaminolyticus]|uniref:Phosphodiester glycosidase family protein n=1 Tax=Paenibacillus thiaminolyticus TaxID=49283 RepID=A0AAP9DSW5_PANTH|nr:phosphodiester glycosidase family protein [Paenibacillus thiaminolyticus]MCY9538775.1 phosphodiester glycosidase family protein [Paenibacillus thiaminolyticus]MCY9605473.1 phosphodiester glycosidase family protein [Paenibacillus thiaminolyticus]MCY9611026.1 phosphodiester glycosidase family protein [Paenibacillus thiaminolyticus]MCY9616119.1 phosphodiester glycosidase family protein [Paenibacillus thiaminolyticus]MCY9621644.1 phosphodiester glycosidase family protein [Paenibacillus thiamino
MNVRVKQINRLFMLITAPFIGMMIWMLASTLHVTAEVDWSPPPEPAGWTDKNEKLYISLDEAQHTASFTVKAIQKTSALYRQTTQAMNDIVSTAGTQAKRPEQIYDRRISAKLGTVKERIDSDKLRAELYRINQPTYQGYAMKVKLKDPSAMRLTLGKDKYGGSETTMQAVKRYGAVAGINAGGFADGKGNRYPLGTTVMDGEYVHSFEPTYKDLAFVGLDAGGKLIGGKFSEKQQLDTLKPQHGATFVPALLKNGRKLAIPQKWQSSRAPRTVIGNYKDDQLLILVADGYDEKGSSGAKLEELQAKLSNLGVIDAYNLDGGGSSSLIFNGRVVNNPSDGELRALPTHFLFFK